MIEVLGLIIGILIGGVICIIFGPLFFAAVEWWWDVCEEWLRK